MGRKSDKGHKSHKEKDKSKHEAERRATRKSIKPSKSHKHSKSVVQHVSKKPDGVKKASKPKQTVNIAGVFKKPKHDVTKHHKNRQSTPSPESTLADHFKKGIEHARATIDAELSASFNAAHRDLLHKLSESRKRDVSFFESIAATAAMLSAPLSEECIEVQFTRTGGTKVIETVTIGEQMAKFKKSVEKEEAKLKDYWKQWEDVQGELIELGMDVFGPEAFGEKTPEGKAGNGYKKEMELLDIGHNAKVLELTEEIKGIAKTFLEKMKTSEKELDKAARAKQAKLLQALIQET